MCLLRTVFWKNFNYCGSITYSHSSIFTILKLLHTYIWMKGPVTGIELMYFKTRNDY